MTRFCARLRQARAWHLRVLAGLLRLVVLAFVLHGSGLLHDTLDVLAGHESTAAQHAGCAGSGGDEHGCPPACPECHCSARSVGAPAASSSLAALLSPLAASAPRYLAAVRGHSGPEPGGIFRPPRA